MPRPASGAIGPCIGKAGDYPCPTTGAYTVKRLLNTGVPVDARTCGACATCGVTGTCSCNSGGQPCGAAFFDGLACVGTRTDVPAQGSCTSITVATTTGTTAQMVGVLGPNTTTCVPPGPAAPTGSISSGPKVTVCCGQ
jgi:hypothetical protein